MLSWQHLDQLVLFDGAGERVLSLYLDLEPAQRTTRTYRIQFKDLVKAASEGLSETERHHLAREADRVNRWLDRLDRSRGLGLMLFSCIPRALWLTDLVNVRVRNHLAFDVRPDVAGLLEIVDDYERFAVALVSKDKARIFMVFAGSIEEIDVFEDWVPARTDTGRLNQSRNQRHHDVHVLWHLKKVVVHLSTLQSRSHFDRLLIMGPVEATSALQELLPHSLKTSVAALVRAEADATSAEILERALEVERRIEADTEDRLVTEVVEMAGSGARATCGVDATLEALWAAGIRTLIIAETMQLSGTECSNCGRLHRGHASICPNCGAATHVLPDFNHQVAGRAAEQGGRVEVVHGAAAKRLDKAGEGLAAFLRFTLPDSSLRKS